MRITSITCSSMLVTGASGASGPRTARPSRLHEGSHALGTSVVTARRRAVFDVELFTCAGTDLTGSRYAVVVGKKEP